METISPQQSVISELETKNTSKEIVLFPPMRFTVIKFEASLLLELMLF